MARTISGIICRRSFGEIRIIASSLAEIYKKPLKKISKNYNKKICLSAN